MRVIATTKIIIVERQAYHVKSSFSIWCFFEGGGHYRTTVQFYFSEDFVKRVNLNNIGTKTDLLGFLKPCLVDKFLLV